MISKYQLGSTHLTLQTLDQLGLPNPFPTTFTMFTETYVDGAGRPGGDGFAEATWHFDVLTSAQFATLVAYLGGLASGPVNIVTRVDGLYADYDDQFTEWHGYIGLPDFEQSLGRRYYQDVTFRFTSLQRFVRSVTVSDDLTLTDDPTVQVV